MQIPQNDWDRYIKKLAAVNNKAAEQMRAWIDLNGYGSVEDMIQVARGLTQKYGEAAAALACQMYDAIAEASGVSVAAAAPAEVFPESYVAGAVRAKLETAPTQVPSLVSRMVKQAGADTMLKNAQRDGAQFAWVPHGDTCAFCITLASRGWQYMSKKALKTGHAEHIHANCDCTYAIRFDSKSGVAGYDPQEYADIYQSADGNTPQEKVNAMRRAQRAKNRDAINARKRILYQLNNKPKFVSAQLRDNEAMNEFDYWSEKEQKYRLNSIIENTGFSKEEAEKTLEAFSSTRDQYLRNASTTYEPPECWFYRADAKIRQATSGKYHDAALTIDKYIMSAPKYDGEIYRGMSLPKDVIDKFEVGGTFTENGNISSWTSSFDVGEMFANGRSEETGNYPVMLVTTNKKYSTPVAHMSIFGNEENEVLVTNMKNNKYKIVGKEIKNGVQLINLELE